MDSDVIEDSDMALSEPEERTELEGGECIITWVGIRGSLLAMMHQVQAC